VRRRLRIEVYDETGSVHGDDYQTDTIAAVEVELPAGVEIPGERLIEGARLAYRHVVGADFHQLVVEQP
jgi:hypothetical protein